MSAFPETSPTAVRINEVVNTPKRFCVGSVMSLTTKRDAELFFRAVEPMCELGYLILVLAEGDHKAQQECFGFAEKYPENFRIFESLPQNQKFILEHSDVVIFPSSPEKVILKTLVEKQIVPVLPSQKHFENFDAAAEKGNAFTFEKGNYWQFLEAIIRASENHKFPYDWNLLRKNLNRTVVK